MLLKWTESLSWVAEFSVSYLVDALSRLTIRRRGFSDSSLPTLNVFTGVTEILSASFIIQVNRAASLVGLSWKVSPWGPPRFWTFKFSFLFSLSRKSSNASKRSCAVPDEVLCISFLPCPLVRLTIYTQLRRICFSRFQYMTLLSSWQFLTFCSICLLWSTVFSCSWRQFSTSCICFQIAKSRFFAQRTIQEAKAVS